jgi:hypothetical protein
MRKKQEIEFVFKPDGTVEIDAIGFEGRACHDEIMRIVGQLGRVKDSKRKADFYQDKVRVGRRNQIGGQG